MKDGNVSGAQREKAITETRDPIAPGRSNKIPSIVQAMGAE